MSVKVHEAFSIDSFQDRLIWWDDFLGDQLKDEWTSTGDAGGSAVVVDAQTGGIVRITTDGDSGDAWRIDWGDIRSLHVNKKVTMEVRAKLNHGPPMTLHLQLLFDAANRVGFFETGVDFGLLTANGALTTASSDVPLDTNYHIFRIECFPTGEVHFYIDRVEQSNSPITTNIPNDAEDFLQPYLSLETGENSVKSMDIDYCVVRQEI